MNRAANRGKVDLTSVKVVEDLAVVKANGSEQGASSAVTNQLHHAGVTHRLHEDPDLDRSAIDEEMNVLRLAPKTRTVLYCEDPTIFSQVHKIFHVADGLRKLRRHIQATQWLET